MTTFPHPYYHEAPPADPVGRWALFENDGPSRAAAQRLEEAARSTVAFAQRDPDLCHRTQLGYGYAAHMAPAMRELFRDGFCTLDSEVRLASFHIIASLITDGEDARLWVVHSLSEQWMHGALGLGG